MGLICRKNLKGYREFRYDNYRTGIGPNKYIKSKVEITLCCDWDLLISYGGIYNRSFEKNCFDINYVADMDGIIFGIRIHYIEYSYLIFETKKSYVLSFSDEIKRDVNISEWDENWRKEHNWVDPPKKIKCNLTVEDRRKNDPNFVEKSMEI